MLLYYKCFWKVKMYRTLFRFRQRNWWVKAVTGKNSVGVLFSTQYLFQVALRDRSNGALPCRNKPSNKITKKGDNFGWFFRLKMMRGLTSSRNKIFFLAVSVLYLSVIAFVLQNETTVIQRALFFYCVSSASFW